MSYRKFLMLLDQKRQLAMIEFPFQFIKQSIQIIAEPLAHIINLSFTRGIFLDQKNILPSFSKFLEKVVYSRLYNYWRKLEILCDNQFGSRKNHSTSVALIDLNEKKFPSPSLSIAMDMPLVFSLIFLRLLIPSIIIFRLNTMVYVAWFWTGLEATSPTGCNSFNLTVNAPLHKLSAVVSPRDLIWALCVSCCTLMI